MNDNSKNTPNLSDVESYLKARNHILPELQKIQKICKIKSFIARWLSHTFSILAFLIPFLLLTSLDQYLLNEYGIAFGFINFGAMIILSNLVWNRHLDYKYNIINQYTRKLPAFESFKKKFCDFILDQRTIYTLSLMSNYFQDEQAANNYRVKVFELINAVKNKNVSQEMFSFWENQDENILALQQTLKENEANQEKVDFIKQIENNLIENTQSHLQEKEFNFYTQTQK